MTDGGSAGAFLRLLAERAAADPAYLSWAVRMYAEIEGQSLADVLTRLGVADINTPEFLVSLRPTGECFPEMLRAICARFGSDETVLLGILREVEVLEALRAGGVRASADAGLLMAARMREEAVRQHRVAEDIETYRDDEGQDDTSRRQRNDEGGDAR